MSESGGGAPGAGGNGAGVGVEARFRDAIARHQGGELDEARGIYEDILRDQPGHAESLHMLGVLAHQQGRNEDAARLIADAIDSDDSVAFYHNNLGEVLRIQGEAERAAACYRKAIERAPNYAEAHNNLGLVLFQLDQVPKALEEFNVSIAIDPDVPTTHNNLGVVLEATNRLEDAIPCFRRSLEIAPDQAEVNNNLGVALHATGEYEEAEKFLQAAARIDPKIANVHYNLSRLHLDQGRLDDAVAAGQQAVAIDPRYPEYHMALGAAQRARGELEAALSTLRAAVALDPSHAQALNDLGVCLLVLGRFDEAESSFRRALDAEPRLAMAHENLARTRRFGDADRTQIDFVEALASAANHDDAEQAHLHFALGKMLDDVAEYERAFGHIEKANALEDKRMRFDAAAGDDFVARTRASVTAELVAEKRPLGNPSDAPIFIVGMLRSGTTLIEQVLASHPLVHGGGELEFFRNVARQLPAGLGGTAYPDCLRAVDGETVNSIAVEYLNRMRGELGDATRFTDKNPLNYEHLGLILMTFPQAKVIHCMRDPMDVALSVYFQHFNERHDFAYSFAGIAACYRQYLALMDHWRGIFPDRIHDVSYESLVKDFEAVGRDMLAFLDLEWDESCREFHRTVRPVGTSSHWQVRQPLYDRSVGRWRHYESFIGELKSALEASRES